MSSRPDGAIIADALGLRRRGSEWVGPCPRCGGTDRFHVRARDGRVQLPEYAARMPPDCSRPSCGRPDVGTIRPPPSDGTMGHHPRCPYDSHADQHASPTIGTCQRPSTEPLCPPTGPRRRGTWIVAESGPRANPTSCPRPFGGVPAQVLRPLKSGAVSPIASRTLTPWPGWRCTSTMHREKAILPVGSSRRSRPPATELSGRYGAGWKRNCAKVEVGLIVPLDTDSGDSHLTEGEADALAVASTLETGRVVCAAGTAGWKLSTCDDACGRRIVLHPDNDYGRAEQGAMKDARNHWCSPNACPSAWCSPESTTLPALGMFCYLVC